MLAQALVSAAALATFKAAIAQAPAPAKQEERAAVAQAHAALAAERARMSDTKCS